MARLRHSITRRHQLQWQHWPVSVFFLNTQRRLAPLLPFLLHLSRGEKALGVLFVRAKNELNNLLVFKQNKYFFSLLILLLYCLVTFALSTLLPSNISLHFSMFSSTLCTFKYFSNIV